MILLILEYYKIKNASLNALEGRMTGILWIFYVAYENKKYDSYQKYSIMMFDLLLSFKQDEEEQILYENEKKIYTIWSCYKLSKRLQEQFL